MKSFEDLQSEDLQLLIDTPILVTILIGGADGDLDENEKTWGDKLAHIRTTTEERILQDYYVLAAENFSERLNLMFDKLPNGVDERNEIISTKLAKLNGVYENLDRNFVEELNISLRSFAQQIAEASGGFLGFGAESYQEHQWVDLSMIKK